VKKYWVFAVSGLSVVNVPLVTEAFAGRMFLTKDRGADPGPQKMFPSLWLLVRHAIVMLLCVVAVRG